MKLTEAEKQAVRRGELVEFQEGDVRCVVLRSDSFERVRSLLDSSLPAEVITSLVDESISEIDTDDPLLASYQQYKR